jgi:5'-3' exonuclease
MSGPADRRNAEPLYLLDATLLFFRALYGMPDVFTDGQGRSVNGVRGYLSYLLNLLRGEGDTGLDAPVRFCAAAFDESLNSCWRNERYPDYKANRPPADDNIAYQLARARELTSQLGVPVLADLAYEADDFIATLARKSRRPVTVISRDKDLQQLLAPDVRLLDPKDGTLRGPEAFVAEFGFEPARFPDYQAFVGDSVDNIPGIRGVGPKAAGALIRRFGDLESVYAGQAAWTEAGIKPGSRMAERLLADREQAFLFREILRLDDKVPLSITLADTRVRPPVPEGLRASLADGQLQEGLGRSLIGAMEAYVG